MKPKSPKRIENQTPYSLLPFVHAVFTADIIFVHMHCNKLPWGVH